MQVELFDTFLTVLEYRNFGRAADVLGVSQSTVSARVRHLEKLVGSRLFERGRIGASPTPAGLRLESHARLLRAAWNHARRDAGTSSRHDQVLRLSGQLSLMRLVLVDWIVVLRQTRPRWAIDLQADYSPQIIHDVSIGRVDIGILFSPQYLPDLRVEEEGIENFAMVSTISDSLADISVERYINTGYTDYFDRQHQELLPHLANAPMSVAYEELASELLNKMGGSAYVPERLVGGMEATRRFQRVKDAPKIAQPIFSVVHVRRRHNGQVAQALEVLRELL